MPEILVRDFADADAAACAAIFDRAWHAGHPYAPRRIDVAVFLAETRAEHVVVAETEGRIVGFAALYAPQSFVHHLYVDPASHGRGIGRALLGRAVALAGGTASLKCQLRNAAALGFYRRLGWRDAETGGGTAEPWVRLLSP
jgi:ribosomal protein S18 acetylase RimI-like enzyme